VNVCVLAARSRFRGTSAPKGIYPVSPIPVPVPSAPPERGPLVRLRITFTTLTGLCMGRGPGANRFRYERPESYLRCRSSDSLPLITERQSLPLFPAAASAFRIRPASPRINRFATFAVTGCRLSPIEWLSPPIAEASSIRPAFAAGLDCLAARLGVNHGRQSNYPPAGGHFCLSTVSA
jgi:hypothetical protein